MWRLITLPHAHPSYANTSFVRTSLCQRSSSHGSVLRCNAMQSVFKVKSWRVEETHFYPEDGGSTFLRNAHKFLNAGGGGRGQIPGGMKSVYYYSLRMRGVKKTHTPLEHAKWIPKKTPKILRRQPKPVLSTSRFIYYRQLLKFAFESSLTSSQKQSKPENCGLLGYYEASTCNFLPTFRYISAPIFGGKKSESLNPFGISSTQKRPAWKANIHSGHREIKSSGNRLGLSCPNPLVGYVSATQLCKIHFNIICSPTGYTECFNEWVLFSTYVISTCFGPHRSNIRSVLCKLYVQIWYVL